MYKPSYLKLYKNGELAERVSILKGKFADCTICPHGCRVDRHIENSGFCESYDTMTICSFCAHHGEEPPVSGSRGSGTVFFGRCNMHCVFCQNADISQGSVNTPSNFCSPSDLAGIMIDLQNNSHCHNINFVSPSHFVPQIVEAVHLAIPLGLRLPLVYNSNGYDHLDTLRLLDGIIDIYLPDLKYADDSHAREYSAVPNYVSTARDAINEMFRQVGLLSTDNDGIAQKGLIIRHLVLPNNIAGTLESLQWIARELSTDVTLSLMAQYYPAHRAAEYNPLSQLLSAKEYFRALQELQKLGFNDALYQEPRAAHCFRPDFSKKNKPFADGS